MITRVDSRQRLILPMTKRDTALSGGIIASRRCPRLFHTRSIIGMLQANDTPNARLLILDEDRIILQSLGQFLRREGYEVGRASCRERV